MAKEDHQVVSTDGVCSRNGRLGACAGIGVFFGPSDPRNVSEPLDDDDCHTTQRAELYALGKALELLLAAAPRHTSVFSDSEYAINCITRWASNWQKRGWRKADGDQVKNLDIIQPAFAIWERLAERGDVSVSHVEREFNCDAESLAVAGARIAKDERHEEEHVVVVKAGYVPS